MQAKKNVQIILIILCAIIILAGCADVQPQDEVAWPSNTTPIQQQTKTTASEPEANIVTISIDCRRALEAGVAGAPEGGWIMEKKEVELQEGDTVWSILDRICRQRSIAVSKSGSGAGIFVKAIGGVAAVSAQSGWIYSVNETYIMTSSGSCEVKAGDSIRWKYTMDGENDI